MEKPVARAGDALTAAPGHLAYVLRPRGEPLETVAGLFVDRDGVLNRREVDGYVLDPGQLLPLEAAIPALARASGRGVPVVIASNQGCLSQRLLDRETLEGIHAKLLDHLSTREVQVTAIYVCPHHPAAVEPGDRSCGCRKPNPGLLTAAATDLGLDLSRSVFVGDQETDRGAAEAAGIPKDNIWLVDPARMAGRDAIRLADGVMAALAGGRGG